VLYILDEPSIGLHQRDNIKLIKSLKELRDLGNTIIVVEHDRDMMLQADNIIDIGPGPGVDGGKIVAKGNPKEFLNLKSLTSKFLRRELDIKIPIIRRKGNGNFLKIFGAEGNNLKKINCSFPLGLMISLTGVSGSGKSTLIHETISPILKSHINKSRKIPLKYFSCEGIEYLNKIIEVDQSPIGRTPRSNPATYTGVFTDIRNLFSSLPESKIRGLKQGAFSFNVKGGRCENCRGAGLRLVEMDFLPSVFVNCEVCEGKRYNRDTLEVRFKGKSISDVLNMTVSLAVDFFNKQPKISNKLIALNDVGLGYISLGQYATTLSGGEAQRVKLASELNKKDTGKTLFLLDEPTTGLHFQDIKNLMLVLNRLVERGNTVLIIEHNIDVIKSSDYVIDLGLEGGDKGGKIICVGTPEELAKSKLSYTGHFLNLEFSKA
jgi:excinuclease ABC subunit A